MTTKKEKTSACTKGKHGGKRTGVGPKPKKENQELGAEINRLDNTEPYSLARGIVRCIAAGDLEKAASLLTNTTTAETRESVQDLLYEVAAIIARSPKLASSALEVGAIQIRDGVRVPVPGTEQLEADRRRLAIIIRKIENLLDRKKIAKALHIAAAKLPPNPMSRMEAKKAGLSPDAESERRELALEKVRKRAERAPSAAKWDFLNGVRVSSTGGKKSHRKK